MTYFWFILNCFGKEEDVITSINNHLEHMKMTDKVKEMVSFIQYKFIVGPEIPPTSEALPKTIKVGKTIRWVKLANENYKKVRLTQIKPLKGMIFINMAHDFDMFDEIKGCAANLSFQGGQEPQIITDEQFELMRQSIQMDVPDFDQYIQDYVLSNKGQMKDKTEKEVKEEVEKPITTISEEVAEIGTKINPKKLQVNDYVFVTSMSINGVVLSIDFKNTKALVGVQLFGRRQSIDCTFDQLRSV